MPLGAAPGTPLSMSSPSVLGDFGGGGNDSNAIRRSNSADLSMVSVSGGRSYSAAPKGIVNSSLSYTFLCPKCRRQQPISMGVPRGNQTICEPDIQSYRSLQQRWGTQRKLREWWIHLDGAAQAAWYCKWQEVALSPTLIFLKNILKTYFENIFLKIQNL